MYQRVVFSEEFRRWSSSRILFRRWVTGTPPCDPNLSHPLGNHRSVHLTRSVRRRAASFSRAFRKLGRAQFEIMRFRDTRPKGNGFDNMTPDSCPPRAPWTRSSGGVGGSQQLCFGTIGNSWYRLFPIQPLITAHAGDEVPTCCCIEASRGARNDVTKIGGVSQVAVNCA